MKWVSDADIEHKVSDEHRNILDDRIDAYESAASTTLNWEEVKKRFATK